MNKFLRAANESKKKTKKDGKEKKTVIDIIDFERIDFAQYVGKNNNIKQRNGVNNVVKLLGQRFPQLENTARPSIAEQENSAETDQEQDNEQGVGRKYAFRYDFKQFHASRPSSFFIRILFVRSVETNSR